MAKNSSFNWLLFGVGGMFFIALLILGIYLILPVSYDGCIGVIEISGELVSQDVSPSLFYEGVKGSETIADEIGSADERRDVKAVLILIDSPGGTVVASRQVYEAVHGLEKPSVAYINEFAASGAYYVAAGTDRIVSNPDAITGSIGSKMQFTEMSGLFGKLGINETVVKTGAMKDIGSPAREMTPEERASLQELVNESFVQFVGDVKMSRGSRLNQAEFEKMLDGRIISGRKAERIGMVDELGNKKAAISAAARLANMTDTKNPSLCDLSGGKKSGGIFGSLSSQAEEFIRAQAGIPRLSYK